MSNPPKIDRKTLRGPDAFIVRGQNTLGFLVSHKNSYMPILAGIAVAVGIYYSYDWWVGRRSNKAWRAYYAVTKLADTKKWEKMKSLYGDQKSSRTGAFAAVNVADHYYSEARKQFPKDAAAATTSAASAVEWYGKALDFTGLQAGERQLLLVNRGNSHELQKKWDDAQKDYESAVNVSGEGKAWALLNLGRVWELKNDIEKAKQTYEKVTLEFANSEYAKQAKNNIRRMKSASFQTAKASNG